MKFIPIKFLLSIFFLIVFALTSSAQNEQVAVNSGTQNLIVNNVWYLADNTLSLSISDLTRVPIAEKFVKTTASSIVPANKSCYWLKFQVQNKDDRSGEWLLNFDNWQYVDFYKADSGQTIRKVTGRLVPFLNRDVPLANHCFIRLDMKANEQATCYVRLRSDAGGDEVKADDLSFVISNRASVERQENSKVNLIYFFCGIYLVMFLYNLFIYFSTREKGYIYYLGILLLLILAILSNSGYIIQLLSGINRFPSWYPIADLMCSTILGTLIILFTKEFLKLRQNFPQLNQAFNIMIGCLFLMFIPAFWGNLILANNVSSVLGLITMVLILTASIQSYRKKHHSALLFLVAYSVFVVGLGFFLLEQMGIIPVNTVSQFSLEIGSSAEAVIFSFALADRINVLKQQNEASQQRIIEQLNEYNQLQLKLNHELEEKVEQRTHELRQSQKQLLQKEKLAALGELTAGIAHEIQNPLNFVNNFSEVNADLLTEFEQEFSAGNFDEARAIVDNIKDNISKVVYHGKRADGIVKAMLLHSAAGSGKRERVNINQLVDEHLKLAYNGFRAKDKAFQAALKTDQAEGVIETEVVKQDFGRALMNIFNNAFFAVAEKSKAGQEGYEPQVTVSIQRAGREARVVIRDNGTGIKPQVLAKIFQPFFTTKPTGEGTGLGLSLSYDTIKAHGGDITVNTLEGEFTEFIVSLPL